MHTPATTPRFRFAPSPTGSLHVGGARTAILNWLLAKHAGGTFVLRVEDTDVERNVPGAEEGLLDDLRWLGLDWDEGPGEDGAYGPYRQSERAPLHRAAAEELLQGGLAYFCICPPSGEGGGDRRERCGCAVVPYEGAWRDGASVRFRAGDEPVVVRDAIRGEVVFPAGSQEDFVLLRSDGRATYNFAAAVDDGAMRITHVVRGADHLNNTPKQVAIHAALGRPVPIFAHIPLILGPDRQKLSKRHGATSVGEHRRLGFLPEALLNYLSLLSWSSESGEEFLDREQLIREVDLERVGASDAVFDPEKLRWLSHRHLQGLPAAALRERAEPYLGEAARALGPRLADALAAVQERVSTLSEIEAELKAFLGPRTEAHAAAREAIAADRATVEMLGAAANRLERLDPWDAAAIGAAFREVGKDLGFRGRALFHPLRVALTGEEHGPDLARIAFVLGRGHATSLLRLDGV
jgi:nondiscriminating glutamyl-tRNA synthetase